MYVNEESVYIQQAGTWREYPLEEEPTFDATYTDLIASLEEINELLTSEVSDGELRLTYEGNDREVWDAFEEEFSLSIDGVSEEDVAVSMEAVFDEKTRYLTELILDIVGDSDTQNAESEQVTIHVTAEISEHDAVDMTEIEEQINQEMNE